MKTIFTLLFFCSSLMLPAQERSSENIAIGEWRAHIPYNQGRSVALTEDRVYCATPLGLFSYIFEDGSLERYTKVSGLSDVGINKIAFDTSSRILFITYENGNIDLLSAGGTIKNMSDLKRKNIPGSKKANHIYFKDGKAYFSMDFGIMVIDIEKTEILDTYYIGAGGANNKVNAVVITDTSIYAATENGIKQAELSDNLANFQSWTQFTSLSKNVEHLALFENVLFAVAADTLLRYTGQWETFFSDTTWNINNMSIASDHLLITQIREESAEGKVIIFDKNLNKEERTGLLLPQESTMDKNGTVWTADLYPGLFKVEKNGVEAIQPNGPASSNVYKMEAISGEVWVAPGAVTNSWGISWNADGFFGYTYGNWNNVAWWNSPVFAQKEIYDIVAVAFHPADNTKYFGSYTAGVLEYSEGEIKVYGEENSSLQGQVGDEDRIHVLGLAFDKENNLWVSNIGAPEPVSVKKADGQWQSFRPSVPGGLERIAEVIVDDYDQKWFVLPREGLLVFDHGSDIETTNDDQWKKLGKGEGSGNLHSLMVNTVVQDKDGEIWVGTDEGIAVFYCPGDVFSNSGCDAQRILVKQGEYWAYLLETEKITAIAVDGANRKWIGTTNGVWLMSEDGTEEILHFTENNSPLLSDEIMDIAIEPQSGEVFIGTAKGIISYRSTATEGNETHQNVQVFPNPVRPDYTGMIAISGLVENAEVKITDIHGTLVYETSALGGQAVWDGKDYNGIKAQSGVYLVFSTNRDGSETFVAKLLFLN